MSDLLSVMGESRMVPAGISEVGSPDSSQAAIPSIALHSPIRRLSWFSDEPTTEHPRVMECVDPSQ